jgi:hypothetical protein
VGAAAVPDAWIRNGQKRVNGSSGVKRSLDGFRKGAGGQGWLPAGYENPPYGMNRGGGGNEGKTWWPFATMLGRADTQEAIGLNRASPLHSTSSACELVRPQAAHSRCQSSRRHSPCGCQGQRRHSACCSVRSPKAPPWIRCGVTPSPGPCAKGPGLLVRSRWPQRSAPFPVAGKELVLEDLPALDPPLFPPPTSLFFRALLALGRYKSPSIPVAE